MPAFKKGHKKVGGRQLGTPNKINLKECTLKAFDELGAEEYLKNIAQQHPNAFLNFLGKFVSQDIKLSGSEEEGAKPVEFIIRGYNGNRNTSSST
jgi:hypothetical protein